MLLVNKTALKTQMIISYSMIEWDTTSETETLEEDNTVSILMYLCFSEADLGPLPCYNNSYSFQPLIFVTKSSILNAAGIPDPLTNAKGKKSRIEHPYKRQLLPQVI